MKWNSSWKTEPMQPYRKNKSAFSERLLACYSSWFRRNFYKGKKNQRCIIENFPKQLDTNFIYLFTYQKSFFPSLTVFCGRLTHFGVLVFSQEILFKIFCEHLGIFFFFLANVTGNYFQWWINTYSEHQFPANTLKVIPQTAEMTWMKVAGDYFGLGFGLIQI